MITARAAVAGVAGWPVGHSLSPLLHNFWLERYGIDGAYIPLPIRPEDFATTIPALARAGFRGINVTLPHKQAALALCDEADAPAMTIGAVNTLIFHPDGRIEGRNTDAFGFIENISAALHAAPLPRRAVVLGAGGAARAVLWALLQEGIRDITIINRNLERAQALAADMASAADGGPVQLHCGKWEERGDLLEGAELLVNTTSLGMEGQPPLEISPDPLAPGALVTDIVYTPLLTPLLAAARAAGYRVVDGLGMLMHQARPGFTAWFGHEAEVDEALRKHLLQAVSS